MALDHPEVGGCGGGLLLLVVGTGVCVAGTTAWFVHDVGREIYFYFLGAGMNQTMVYVPVKCFI
jgi:hypothetical protein